MEHQHPIKNFINQLFSNKPMEQRNNWANYLIEQKFHKIDDLKNVSEQAWAKMNPNIPLSISSTIRKQLT